MAGYSGKGKTSASSSLRQMNQQATGGIQFYGGVGKSGGTGPFGLDTNQIILAAAVVGVVAVLK